MAPLLGYLHIRGLGQPIRLMLAYSETAFEEKKYYYGPAPAFEKTEWLKEKENLGLDFPNLPYYIDGDVKITQSIAIMRYLARKHKLEPVNEEEKISADMVEQQINDIRDNFFGICYSQDFEKLKEDYLKNLPIAFKRLSKFLGKRDWFASPKKLTYVDFLAYETLDQHKILAPDCLTWPGVENLKDFVERFEELPTIKKYMKSSDFLKNPVCGDRAFFGTRFPKK